MPRKPSARAVFIRQSVLEAEARKEVSSVQVGLFPFMGTPQLALFSRPLPAFTSPADTYIPLYTSFPCWFCSRVLARSMGNTQVTPTRPAIPPLMSFAEMLRSWLDILQAIIHGSSQDAGCGALTGSWDKAFRGHSTSVFGILQARLCWILSLPSFL